MKNLEPNIGFFLLNIVFFLLFPPLCLRGVDWNSGDLYLEKDEADCPAEI